MRHSQETVSRPLFSLAAQWVALASWQHHRSHICKWILREPEVKSRKALLKPLFPATPSMGKKTCPKSSGTLATARVRRQLLDSQSTLGRIPPCMPRHFQWSALPELLSCRIWIYSEGREWGVEDEHGFWAEQTWSESHLQLLLDVWQCTWLWTLFFVDW